MLMTRAGGALLVAASLLFTVSCSSARRSRKAADAAVLAGTTPKGSGVNPAYTPGVDVQEASLHTGPEFASVPELGAVHFEYDSYTLGEVALAVLKKNAEYLKENQDLESLASGHCDERGTIEYNLALGQNRAKEVREYYIRLGVPAKSMATISFGKEKQLCSEATEECWAQNRRAETGVRARPAGGTAPAAPDAR